MIRKFGVKKNKSSAAMPAPNGAKLETEQLISAIALRFVGIIPGLINQTILDSLEKIQIFTVADRVYIYMFKQKNKQLKLKYLFNEPGSDEKIAQHDQVDGADFAWMMRSLNDHRPLIVESGATLPAQASTLKLIMDAENTKSMILVPLFLQNVLMGVIGLDAIKKERAWSDDVTHLLTKSGEIFMRVLDQKMVVTGESKSEFNLNILFNHIADVIFISSPEGKLLDINPAALKLFGYESRQEMMNLQVDRDLYYDPDDYKRYTKLMEEEDRIKEYKLALKHKDGTKINVEETSTVIRNDSGAIIGYIGILRDLTEKLTLEQQFFQAQKMESIGLLAGGIAHDFNNILTAITGYADLMILKLGKTHPLYKFALNILQASERAENLVRQLLGFSRKQMIEPRVIDINEEIGDLNKMLTRLIKEDIHFELNLSDGLKNIKADPVQIQQILVNLVVNAGHAIKEQGLKNKEKFIRIATSEVRLTEEFVKRHPGSISGNYVLITIEDSGIGMDEEIRQKIFEPFFTTKKEGEGTGLGLATVYGIIKQNNAYIYVDSAPGKGSVFKIYWPVTSERKKNVEKESASLEYEPHTECILIAEDDDHVRELASSSLKSLGYKVIEAKNGKQALEIIEEQNIANKIDLLFTDMIMPEMGGEELAHKLRQINPNIKILLSSGYNESQIYFSGEQKRTGYFRLNKPYTIQKLESKIRKVLQ